MLVNFKVLLPAIMPATPGNQFDGRGVATPSLPYWLANLRVRRYGARVAHIVEKELAWFSNRGTPSQCLSLLESHENNGPQGGERWDQIHRYLRALVGEVA